ncbi:MAG: hypothetical protein WDO71_04370 [Bacteroidota bacterium]
MAKTIVSKANFLMLDEPTNHLDMHSCDLLIDALTKYEGSMILVSHDRYFVSKTANKIWEIIDHEIKEFKGGYEEYVAWKERMAKQEKEQAAKDKAQGTRDKEQGGKNKKSEAGSQKPEVGKQKTEKPNESKGSNQASGIRHHSSPPINKDDKKELQKQQKIFQQLEERIATLNKKKSELEASLVDPAIYSDKTKFVQAESDYKKSGDELAKLNAEYEKVFETIMQLEAKQ